MDMSVSYFNNLLVHKTITHMCDMAQRLPIQKYFDRIYNVCTGIEIIIGNVILVSMTFAWSVLTVFDTFMYLSIMKSMREHW